jgi:hypothetical protein
MSSQVAKYMKVVLKAGKVIGKRAKKVSGYNVFSMESRVGMEGAPGEIMARLGGMWKNLSEVKQKEFNMKAEKLNAKAVAEFEEPETDIEFEKLKCMIEATIKEYKKQVKNVVSRLPMTDDLPKALDKCTVAELKVMCKNKKMATTGTKMVLLERLQAPVEEEEVEEEEVEEEEVEEEEVEEEEEEVDLEKCSVAELKNLCKERDLSTTGTRAVLMKRIMEAEGVEDEE